MQLVWCVVRDNFPQALRVGECSTIAFLELFKFEELAHFG